jgi:hypothetical protein
MNGAIALAYAAGVLVDLGYADEARRLFRLVTARTARAGVEDASIIATATRAEAGAARLRGDFDAAMKLLGRIELTVGHDEPALVERERARLAWARGDRGESARRYEAAAAMFDDIGYAGEAAQTRAESTRGPAPLATAERPLEEWSRRATEAAIAGATPYAVVASFPMDRPLERFHDLEDRVRDALERAGAGDVDGDLVGADEWILYLDGDDPERVWAVAEPILRAANPKLGAYAEVRENGSTRRVDLA